MTMRFAWLAVLALSLAACSSERTIDGFKDIKFGATEAALTKLGFECSATNNQCKQHPSPIPYTLFGKTGSVTVDLGKEGVEAISVGVEMPAEQLVELYTKQYGTPLSFSDTDLFGGRLTRFYWRFENGTAVLVTKREAKGALQPQVPYGFAIDESAVSSALYLNSKRAVQMLSRAKGNQVNSSDL